MDKIRAALEQAMQQKDVVTVAYAGGSRPGQARNIVVLALGEDKVDIVEPPVHIRKSYLLGKVLWIQTGDGMIHNPNPASSPVRKPLLPEFSTLQEYAALFRETCLPDSWWIETTDTSISVGDTGKHGRPSRVPKVKIEWQDPSLYETLDEGTGELVNVRGELPGKEKPWQVYNKRQGYAKRYAVKEKALITFIEELKLAIDIARQRRKP